MMAPGGKRRTWLWAVLVFASAALCAVLVAVVLAFTAGKGRGAGDRGSGGSATAAPPAPRLGGPFLDPIPTRPQQLWTAQLAEISTPYFAGANRDVAVLYAPTRSAPGSVAYAFLALDAATGAKQWQFRVPVPSYATRCALSGDSQVVCWRDNTGDASSPEGIPPHASALTFVSSKDGKGRSALSAEPGSSDVLPLRDGFLLFKNPYAPEGAASTVTAFSSSGDQRWTARSLGGHPRLALAEHIGLLVVQDGDGGVAQVLRISDGRQVGDFSELTSGPASQKPDLRVKFNAAGFTAESRRLLLDVFDAEGRKVNQIAGWRTVWASLGASSAACGKILLENNSGAFAAADAASGQILWQSPPEAGASIRGASCVGDYFLVQSDKDKELGVYDAATGRRTASIAFEKAPMVVGTDGSVVLVRTNLGQNDSYNAYELSNGRRVWSSPSGEDGKYLFSATDGRLGSSRDLVGGGIYLLSEKNLSRLGRAP